MDQLIVGATLLALGFWVFQMVQGRRNTRARRQAEQLRYDDRPPLTPPSTCPLTLDQLLTASCLELEAAFPASGQ